MVKYLAITLALLTVGLIITPYAQTKDGIESIPTGRNISDIVSLVPSWENGLRFGSKDGSHKFQLGGRIMNDWAFFGHDAAIGELRAITRSGVSEEAIGDIKDATEFRSARLYLGGTIYDFIDFKVEYDFARGNANFKDVYMSYLCPRGGYLRVGHFKEPFGLEQLTRGEHITFMERSLPIRAFAPGRNTGIGTLKTALDDRMTWGLGVFRKTDRFGFGEGSDYNFTGRLTYLPWYDESLDGNYLLHIGGSASYRNTQQVRYKIWPESHLAPRLGTTGKFDADNVLLYGLESAFLKGPFSVQAEYIVASPDVEVGEDPDFSGYYLSMSYFLTGEQRNYDISTGNFGRITPNKYLRHGGYGALELAGRVSSLDLDDQGIDGGKIDDITLGVNWYLNPNSKVMANYINSDIDGVGGLNIFQMRFQVDF